MFPFSDRDKLVILRCLIDSMSVDMTNEDYEQAREKCSLAHILSYSLDLPEDSQ